MSSAVVCTVTHVYMHRLTHVYTVYGYYNYIVHVMPLICTSREVRSITCADTAIIVNHREAELT